VREEVGEKRTGKGCCAVAEVKACTSSAETFSGEMIGLGTWVRLAAGARYTDDWGRRRRGWIMDGECRRAAETFYGEED
jgi:hypothetical protein